MAQDPETPCVSPTALLGKTALVTGGARRIGASIVNELHQAGMNVIIHYHRSNRDAELLAEKLNEHRPGSATTVAGDLIEDGQAQAIVDAAGAHWGRLDLLVNNASSFYPTPIGEIDANAWNDLIGTNLKAPCFLAQAAREPLRNSGGAIVNIADIHADRPFHEHTVYCAAKAGLLMLTRSLARELAPEIRVNAVSPGAILWPTESPSNSPTDTSPSTEGKTVVLDNTPLARLGEPRDIARTVLFLMRDAPYITGQNISVDGGRTLGYR